MSTLTCLQLPTYLSGVRTRLLWYLNPHLTIRSISKKTYGWPEIKETDLDEEFMRGWGPGGQAVAKTSNCVQLRHRPSGIIVKCHETRSIQENRQIARKRLIYKLDMLINKENSFDAMCKREIISKKHETDKRNKRTNALKKEFKEREGLD